MSAVGDLFRALLGRLRGRRRDAPSDPGPPPGDAPCASGAASGGETISCEEALARIHDFLDGELEGLTHEQVDRHFDLCGRCHPRVALERNFREAVHRAVDRRQAPPELRARVLDLIAEVEKDGG